MHRYHFVGPGSVWLKCSSQKDTEEDTQLLCVPLLLAVWLYWFITLSKQVCLPELRTCLSLSAHSAGTLCYLSLQNFSFLIFSLTLLGFIHSLTLSVGVLFDDCDFCMFLANILLWSVQEFVSQMSALYKCVLPWFPSLNSGLISSSGIHCVLATQWAMPYTSSSAVHTNTSNHNKITDIIFETCFCNWYLKTIFHQEAVTCNQLIEVIRNNSISWLFFLLKRVGGFMMRENLNYCISKWMLQFLKGLKDVVFRKLHLRYGSWMNSPIVFLASSSVLSAYKPKAPSTFWGVSKSLWFWTMFMHRQTYLSVHILVFFHNSLYYTMLFISYCYNSL